VPTTVTMPSVVMSAQQALSGSGTGKAFIRNTSNGMRNIQDVLSQLLLPDGRATLDDLDH
jgi:hypothetical protein